MKCNSCWREARKTANTVNVNRPRAATFYQLSGCGHNDRTVARPHRPELALIVTVGPLTPLTEIFPLGIPA